MSCSFFCVFFRSLATILVGVVGGGDGDAPFISRLNGTDALLIIFRLTLKSQRSLLSHFLLSHFFWVLSWSALTFGNKCVACYSCSSMRLEPFIRPRDIWISFQLSFCVREPKIFILFGSLYHFEAFCAAGPLRSFCHSTLHSLVWRPTTQFQSEWILMEKTAKRNFFPGIFRNYTSGIAFFECRPTTLYNNNCINWIMSYYFFFFHLRFIWQSKSSGWRAIIRISKC